MAVESLDQGAWLPESGARPELSDSLFLDRRDELAAIRSCLLAHEVRLLTLTGPGGVGKTRLAVEVGSAVSSHFADGVVFVDLSAVREPHAVLAAIAGSLGFGELGSPLVLQCLQRHLEECELLLILDNVEQILPTARAFARLLAAAPRLTLLLTSREPLHLRCEQVFCVPPLAVPNLDRLPPLAELSQIPSVALFLRRVHAMNPDFSLTEDNARAVAELIVHLDGLPLAVELAAARTTLLSPQMVLERLGQRLSLLRWQAQDLPERHRTLRSAIDWSYELLSPEEQSLFRHLGIFAGSFTLSAAEAIGESLMIDPFESLASLVDKSLVQVQGRDLDNVRYELLETVREYALELLAEAGEQEGVGRVHALHYLALAECAAPELAGPNQRLWFARLECDYQNLRASLQWLLDRDEGELALRLATALAYFWEASGYIEEGRRQLDEALAKSTTCDRALRAKGLSWLGALLLWTVCESEGADRSAEVGRAKSILGEGSALARSVEDRPTLARSLVTLGMLGLRAKRWGRARRLLNEAQSCWRDEHNPQGVAWALLHLAVVELMRGNYSEAGRLADESVACHRDPGDDFQRTLELLVVVSVAGARGETTKALALLQELLALSDQAHNPRLQALCAAGAAWLTRDWGDPERLVWLVGAATAMPQTIGFVGGMVFRMHLAVASEVLQSRIGQEAFDAALAKGRLMSIEQMMVLVEQTVDGAFQHSAPTGAVPKAKRANVLSAREQDVLQLVAEGLSNKQIAREIIVSDCTVRTHLTSIFNKLGVNTRAQAVAVAAARSLVVLQD